MLESSLQELKEKGFMVFDHFSFSSLKPYLKNFGQTLLETDVCIDSEKASLVFSHQSIDFHTDSPEAKWIAWYCLDSGDRSTEFTEIIDGLRVTDNFSKSDQTTIANINFRVNSVDDQYRKQKWLTPDHRLYFCPWLKDSNLSKRERKLTEQFEHKLKSSSEYTEKIYWKKQRLLIIDNHRFLHRRPLLNTNSSRHLLRIWLAGTEK